MTPTHTSYTSTSWIKVLCGERPTDSSQMNSSRGSGLVCSWKVSHCSLYGLVRFIGHAASFTKWEWWMVCMLLLLAPFHVVLWFWSLYNITVHPIFVQYYSSSDLCIILQFIWSLYNITVDPKHTCTYTHIQANVTTHTYVHTHDVISV